MLKKIGLSVSTILMVLLTVLSCGPQPELGIKFKEEIFDFGTQDEGPNIEHTFIFTNTGKQPLQILDVKPTCGCTVADNWDKLVAPGQKGKIPITFKTTGYQDDVSKTINVTTNVPERQTITLTIKMKIRNPVAITPKNVWLGEVTTENTKPLAGSFEIQNNLGVPLKLVEVIPPNDKIKFTLTTLEANMKYKIDFTIDPPFIGEEVMHGEFTVKTDNEKYAEIKPSYSYFIPPPVQIFPTTVYINLDQLSENQIQSSINVKNNTTQPIQVLGLKMVGGKGIKYSIQETTKDKYYQILITVPVNYVYNKDEKVSFIFRVLNDPKNKEYDVPVQFSKTEPTAVPQ